MLHDIAIYMEEFESSKKAMNLQRDDERKMKTFHNTIQSISTTSDYRQLLTLMKEYELARTNFISLNQAEETTNNEDEEVPSL